MIFENTMRPIWIYSLGGCCQIYTTDQTLPPSTDNAYKRPGPKQPPIPYYNTFLGAHMILCLFNMQVYS